MRVATIGNFDGVHRGHAQVLGRLREIAADKGLRPLVITFRQHPLELIAPDRAPRLYLSAFDEKMAYLRELGVDVEALDFDSSLRMMSARDFITMLRDKYGVKVLLLGFNNKIGHDRELTADDYRRIGSSLGVEVEIGSELEGGSGSPISSSQVRKLVRDGEVAAAAELLGRRYSVSGIVGHGKELGRKIGFPTANLTEIGPDKLIPAAGVYAARVILPSGEVGKAMVNIGKRPTVDTEGAPTTFEIHIIDFDGDLYGDRLTVEFVERLRPERRFDSIEALRQQLARDREATLRL